MKLIIKTIIIFCLLGTQQILTAQEILDTYNVPLSNPNQTGKLKVDLQNGTVQVEGYDGKEVVVNFVSQPKNGKKDSKWNWDWKWEDGELREDKSKHGLKKISSSYIDMEIEERNNTVYVEGSHNRRSDLVIQVPKKFALVINAHHNGEVKVSNVTGELEISSHHGGIELENVGGSVIADTHHGAIIGSLVSVTPDMPMAFSTYHGDVDITFPTSISCKTKIKTAKGDIYTDFDLELKSVTENKQSEGGRRKIKIGGWMHGNIGSGGEEFLFNTHHGDVVIRKL